VIEQGRKNYQIKGQLVKRDGRGEILLEEKRKKNGYRGRGGATSPNRTVYAPRPFRALRGSVA
jgi:hypothetical protein